MDWLVQFDCFVVTARGDCLAIGTKGYAIDPKAMPFESLEFFTIDRPQFDGVVVTARGDRLAIGTKGNAKDSRAMPFESLEFFAI
jgi:hypothetical protein